LTAVAYMKECGTMYLSVSEAARRLGARPRDISDLFYRRVMRDDWCPIVTGRRMIPSEYLEMVRAALKRAGRPVDDAGEVGK